MVRHSFELFDQFCIEPAYALYKISVISLAFLTFFVLKNCLVNLGFNSKLLFSIGLILVIFTANYFISFFFIFLYVFVVVFFLYYFGTLSMNNGLKKKISINYFIALWASVIKKNLTYSLDRYTQLLFDLWVVLCLLNIMGMLPYSFAVTTQIIFPFFISLALFIFNNIIAWTCYRFKIFNLFLPKDVPLFITPLLLIVEYISYFARIFSLSIRLCANMLSIHILLKILIGFTCLLGAYTIYAHLLYSLILSIFFLDISACILQGYIFVFLSLVYLSNVIVMH